MTNINSIKVAPPVVTEINVPVNNISKNNKYQELKQTRYQLANDIYQEKQRVKEKKEGIGGVLKTILGVAIASGLVYGIKKLVTKVKK